MVNLSTYGRDMELLKFKQILESFQNEELVTEDKLAQLKSGRAGGQYATQWKALETEIVNKVNANVFAGTFAVPQMMNVTWSVDQATGRVSIKDASGVTQVAGGAAGNIDKAAELLSIALGKDFSENTDSVYKVFQEQIKNKADFDELIAYWDSLHFPRVRGTLLYSRMGTPQNWDKVKATFKAYPPTNNMSLKYWIDNLFSAEEKAKLNSIIKAYTTFQF
jgi:hypothetical protein